MWYEKRPNVNHFRVFGCLAYVHVPDQNRQKLDAKSESCIFVGYSEELKAYKFYNPLTNRLIVLRDVIFDEGGVYGHQKGQMEKSKSVLNDDIDHEQPTNVFVPSATNPSSRPSSCSIPIACPASTPSSRRKVRSLRDIYERSANQAHEENPIGET